MTINRPHVLKAATASAQMMAIPRSVAVAFERLAGGEHRFLVVELAGGQFLAIDTEGARQVYLLRRTDVPDGRYLLDGEGALHVADGAILGVDQPARTKSYTLRRTRTTSIAVTSNASGARMLTLPARRRP
jgi:hypothetical protein